MKNFNFYILIILSISVFQSCYYDNFSELQPGAGLTSCDSTKANVSFSQDIVPILNNSCGTNNSCHGSNNTSFVNLSNYSGVYSSTQGYLLWHVVSWTPNYSKMPKGSQVKISDCNIALIRKWIAAGAPNN